MSDHTQPLKSLIDTANRFAGEGELKKARACYEDACRLDPDSYLALFGLGTILYQLENDSEAYTALAKAAKIAPNVPEIWNNIGAVCGRQGKTAIAIKAFQKVCSLDPEHASAALNLGRILLSNGQAAEAERWLRQSDLARPGNCTTLRHMAAARLSLGQPRLALTAALAAVKADPANIWATLVMGKASLALNNLEQARDAFESVLRSQPGHPDTTYCLAKTMEKAGQIEAARTLFAKVLELDIDPSFKTLLQLKHALALPVIALSNTEIEADRSRIENAIEDCAREGVEDPYSSGGFTNFYLAYQGKNDRLTQQQIAQFYLETCPALATRAPHVSQPAKKDRYKIGILTSFMRNHTVGYLSRGLVKYLDRDRFHVALLRSPIQPIQDPVAKEIAAMANSVVDLPDNLPAARKIVAEAEIDLLYFPEIGMEDLVYFLAFARSAPVQVMGWGHPVTSGIPNIDAYLSVADMEPDNACDHYSEQLITTKGLSLCVERPCADSTSLQESYFGLKPEMPAYLCAQSLFKIHPEFDTVLSALLNQDKAAQLYFIELGNNSDAVFMERISKSVQKNMRRVTLLPRVRSDEFFALLKSADVILDVPHWSGGKTSLESLAAGTPVVHWPGEFMRGRHTLAFYKKMNVMDCVVHDAESYVNTAIRLAHKTDFRVSVRKKIAEKSHLLFNNISDIDEISAIFERMIIDSL